MSSIKCIQLLLIGLKSKKISLKLQGHKLGKYYPMQFFFSIEGQSKLSSGIKSDVVKFLEILFFFTKGHEKKTPYSLNYIDKNIILYEIILMIILPEISLKNFNL